MQEAEVPGDILVDEPERVGQVHLAQPSIVAARVEAEARRSALAAAVHAEYRGLLEGGGQEGTRFVREVMLDEAPAWLDPGEVDIGQALSQVERSARYQLAGSVHHVRQ